MSNKRLNNIKLLKCSTCGRAGNKIVVPGSLTFFDRCTFTSSCTGRLAIDPNVAPTARSEVSWQQTPIVYRTTFNNQRRVEVVHNFGHLGSIVVEVFVEVVATTGVVKQKTSNFIVSDQTATSVIIQLQSNQTGVVLVTDNQYKSPTITTGATSWKIPNLLSANVITIAVDRDVETMRLPLVYRSLVSSTDLQVELQFESHFRSSTPIGNTIWSQFRVIAMEKPYFLYSAIFPNLPKGTAVTLNPTLLTPTIVLPLAEADKTALSDIVDTKIIRNSSINVGDLIMDNNQLIVANSAIIDDLHKPFTIY